VLTPALSAFRRVAADILGRGLSDKQVELFGKYLELLRKWQKIHRLLGSTEPDWIIERVFLDSLLYVRVVPSSVREIVDIGSGAGVPGIPLRIAIPDLRLTMVESRQRRVSFLLTVVRELDLVGATVIGNRLENVAGALQGKFDAVVARCAGDLETLFTLGAKLVKPGGVVVVSGPPKERRLSLGRWVTVAGPVEGKTRRFALYARPAPEV
jgi:16S rRNA (guanine527-N7)-methyltransferase